MPSINETMRDSITAAEQLYFSMFPSENTEKFRRFLLYVVFNTIRENDGITLNRLQWKLHNEFTFEASDVEIAVNALSNQRIFNAVSKFHLPQRRGTESARRIVHLRLRKTEQELVESWVASVLADCPEYSQMVG